MYFSGAHQKSTFNKLQHNLFEEIMNGLLESKNPQLTDKVLRAKLSPISYHETNKLFHVICQTKLNISLNKKPSL